MSQLQITARSPFNSVFLLHVAMEIPLVIHCIWSAPSLPFLELNNTTLVVLKLYASIIFGTCLASLLCYPLPEFLPGKRALAIGLFMYHTTASTILFQSPRFIPLSFGALCETYKFTPEVAWGLLHGVISMIFLTWWQNTVHITSLARKRQ